MHVAIVGGGVAGLVAASELARQGVQVTVLEQGQSFGGQIQTICEDGFIVENGAEGFVARSRSVPALCRRLRIDQSITPQAERRALLLRHGRLSELQAGEAGRILGIPVDPEDLGQGLHTLRDGMGRLTAAMVGELRELSALVNLRTDAPVLALRREDSAWRLKIHEAEDIVADGVILAIAPDDFLHEMVSWIPEPLSACALDMMRSIVSVTLAFRRGVVEHPLDASGLVVAGPRPLSPTACTFSSSKFSGRAPEGSCLLRAFFRPENDDLLDDFDETLWIGRALRLLAPPLGITGIPTRVWVRNWFCRVPDYPADHAALISDLRSALSAAGTIELAGSAYDAPGVDGAVRSGEDAARRILEVAAIR